MKHRTCTQALVLTSLTLLDFLQVLVYEIELETTLLWIPSNPPQVPHGAIVAGYKVNGGQLYVARISHSNRWFAGNYDPHKRCAEFLVFTTADKSYNIQCGGVWEIPVSKYGLYIRSYIYIRCVYNVRKRYNIKQILYIYYSCESVVIHNFC